MIEICRFNIKTKPNMDNESRVYNYFETYMDNLECLGMTSSRAALDAIIGKFVIDFVPKQTDDIIGLAIFDDAENLIDFLYETEDGNLAWSSDHVDAQDIINKMDLY